MIIPDLAVLARADLFPNSWNASAMDDPTMHAQFCTDYIEFALIARCRARSDRTGWHVPPKFIYELLLDNINIELLEKFGLTTNQCFKFDFFSGTGLPILTLPVGQMDKLDEIRNLISDDTSTARLFETIPTRYPIDESEERAADIENRLTSCKLPGLILLGLIPTYMLYPQDETTSNSPERQTQYSTAITCSMFTPSIRIKNCSDNRWKKSSHRSSIVYFNIVFLIPFSALKNLNHVMSRQAMTPRQLLPRGYLCPPPELFNIDSNFETNLVTFVVLCREIPENTTAGLDEWTEPTWDTPDVSSAKAALALAKQILMEPRRHLFDTNPFYAYSSSHITGLTVFSLDNKDIWEISTITATVRSLKINGLQFESFPTAIFEEVWANTTQLEIIQDWYDNNPTRHIFSTNIQLIHFQDSSNPQREGRSVQPTGTLRPFQLKLIYGNKKKRRVNGKLTTNLNLKVIQPLFSISTKNMERISTTYPLIDWNKITPTQYRGGKEAGRNQLCWSSISFFLLTRRNRPFNAEGRWDIAKGHDLHRALNQASRITAKSNRAGQSQGNLVISDNYFTLTTEPVAQIMDLLSAVGYKDERHEQCAVPCDVLLSTGVEHAHGMQFSAYDLLKKDSQTQPNDFPPFTQVHNKILPRPGSPEPEGSLRSRACADARHSYIKAGNLLCRLSNPINYLTSIHRHGSLFSHADRVLLPPRTWSELLPSNTNDPNWGPDLSAVASIRDLRLILLGTDCVKARTDHTKGTWTLPSEQEALDIIHNALINTFIGDRDKAQLELHGILRDSDLGTGLLIVNPTDWRTFDAFRLFIREQKRNGLHFDTFPETAIFTKTDADFHAVFYRSVNNILSPTVSVITISFQAQKTPEPKSPRPKDNSYSHTHLLLCPRGLIIMTAHQPFVHHIINIIYVFNLQKSSCNRIIGTPVRVPVLKLQFTGHLGQHWQAPTDGVAEHLTSLHNISSPEEGTPKPPRVENMASTKTKRTEVRGITLNANTIHKPQYKKYIISPQELDGGLSPTGGTDEHLPIRLNISNPEEGTPKPPRVESMASTKTKKTEVRGVTLYNLTLDITHYTKYSQITQELDGCPSPEEELARDKQTHARSCSGIHDNGTPPPQRLGEPNIATKRVRPRLPDALPNKTPLTWYPTYRNMQHYGRQLIPSNSFNTEEGTPSTPRTTRSTNNYPKPRGHKGDERVRGAGLRNKHTAIEQVSPSHSSIQIH